MDDVDICVNLWYTLDRATELVYALSGKAYALTGGDQEKLSVLHKLAATDFHTARQFPVPQRFKVIGDNGTEIRGAARLVDIRAPWHGQLFEEVFRAIEADLPERVYVVDGVPVKRRATLPRDPLCVTTCLLEDEAGNLIPMVRPAS